MLCSSVWPSVALALLGVSALPRCWALQLGTNASAAGREAAQAAARAGAGNRMWLSTWMDPSRTGWLTIPGVTGELPGNTTAIVTHAGKNDQEFIDMAVMLAISLKRHVPGYPMIALGVQGMTATNRATLTHAGWQVLLVEDWGGIDSMFSDCGHQCADNTFLNRWQDAVEKLNIFRLQFDRVLYLDADTYVVSDKLSSLLTSPSLPDGNIGMVRDGCHHEYNSGVMLFQPSATNFRQMVKMVAGAMTGNTTKMHDQPIINHVYEGRITELDKMYNCMDPTGRLHKHACHRPCKEVVVSHFTGLPKPARADVDFLDIVRRPHSPTQHCFATNHGSCHAWASYYCDLRANRKSLTKHLRRSIGATGDCCHSPGRKSDPAVCRDECPSQVMFESDQTFHFLGVFNKTSIVPDIVRHAARPIYSGPNGAYMFYLKPALRWVVGPDVNSDLGWTVAVERVSCPSETKQWWVIEERPGSKGFRRRKVNATVHAVSDSSR